MILLTSSATKLVLGTSSSTSVDWSATWADISSSSPRPTAGAAQGNVAAATNTDIVAAPASGMTRKILAVSVVNKSTTASVVVSVKKDDGAAKSLTSLYTLQVGDMLTYVDTVGWQLQSAPGAKSSTTFPIYKVGATMEAAGVHHTLGLTSGQPGAWAPGSPGVNGRTTDGTTSTDGGCLPVPTPAAGASYLTYLGVSATLALAAFMLDVLWVNTGLTVTTTTAQNIVTPTLPARDDNGATSGAGCMLGILVTTATTNVAAVTTITASYTNSAGTAGRTATMASFPATGVAGTVVWFQLQSGDSGVRSVESITLGTSLVTGAISVVIGRMYPLASVASANTPGAAYASESGARLWAGACLLPVVIPTAVTAITLTGTAVVSTR